MSMLNSLVTVPAHSSYSITGDLSISAMVKAPLPASDKNKHIVAGDGIDSGVYDLGIVWVISTGHSQMFFHANGGASITADIAVQHPNNTWFQVGVVRDSVAKTIQFYRSGATFGTAQSYANNPSSGAGTLSVFPPDLFDPTTVSVAEVGIWNTKLTAANMLSLSNGSSPACIVAANLVEYIHLDPRKARLQLNMTGGNV